MFDDVRFRHLLLQFGDGGIFLLRLEKAGEVLNLGFQLLIGDAVEVLPQNKPHSDAEQQLGGCKKNQIPECEPEPDGQFPHACCSARIVYPTPRTVWINLWQPPTSSLIHTVRGVGYTIRAEQQA